MSGEERLAVHKWGVKVRLYEEDALGYPASRECHCCSDKRGDSVEPYPCPTVQHLAAAYADRSGYQEDWRPPSA